MVKRKAPQKKRLGRPRLGPGVVTIEEMAMYMEILRGVDKCKDAPEHAAHMKRAVGR